MKRQTFLILITLAAWQIANAQIVTDLVLEAAKVAAEKQLQETFFGEDSTEVDGEGWDERYRTSDEDGEYWSRGDAPPNGVRVGCICMDGTRDDERSTGACQGYGGVRYWLYQISPDSIAWFPTRRHWQHPEELSETELANLASRHRKEKFGTGSSSGFGVHWGVYQMLSVMMICVTIGYIAKLYFASHDKLPD